ncbi:MAG: ATP-dependent helicase, partial [Candidatus Saccharimonadales bacterium]
MSVFDTEFTKLNNAQKEAVEAINGPVLVIAGPGTGKTQLLSMRVANILRKSDADATNILCLTFTNKAATNMRDRLLKLVGPESNKVTVKTFHGFAAEVMNQYPDYFWNGAQLSTAPDAVQLETVQTILAKLLLSNPLSIRFAGQYTATDDVLKALRLAKEAGLTPSKLKSILEINVVYIDVVEPLLTEILTPTLSAKKLESLHLAVQELPEQGIGAHVAPLLSLSTVIQESLDYAIMQDEGTGKTKNVGKWKSRWIQTHDGQKGMFDERRRNDWWLAFCDVYEAYRETLHIRGYYDYSDMLLEVIVQMEQHDDLRATVQERYQYVLIDEFQDSNAAQLRLAHLVADHHAAEGSPNLMAVGDDDQSIFGFNGAELNNMLFFDRNYTETKRIVLQDNYRSSQAILDVTDAIISQAEDRLVNRVPGLSKNLTARNIPQQTGQIQQISFKTKEHQYSEVARLIRDATGDSKDSIAVLARSHESLRQLSSILLDLEVPIRYEQQANVLEHEVIKQVILLSELTAAIASGNRPLVNEKLAILISHPMWQFSPSELWLFATSQYADRSPDWLQMLHDSDSTRAQQLAEWLQWLAQESSYQPLYSMIEYFLGLVTGQHMTSPLHDYYIQKGEITNDYLHGLSAIRMLRDLVTEFSNSTNDTAVSLTDFIAFISINQQNNRGITDESPFVIEGRSVELYTVHKAKGLEFDQVFIIDAVEDAWKPRIAGRKPPANLPLQPPGEHEDDYIRLLYVAATRAKHSLFVTSYQFDSSGKDVLATPFIRQAIPEATVSQQTEVSVVTILEENLRWPRLNSKDEKALLRGRLANYNLSATHLLTFLDVAKAGPQVFLERHILRLPTAK